MSSRSDDTPTFRVRVAKREGDVARCIALRAEVLRQELGVDGLGDEEPQDRDATHFLAAQGGEIVGTARLRVVAERVGRVDHVVVAESQRASGVGRAVMNSLRDRARAMGLTVLRLPAHEAAVPFYERLGYSPVGEPFEEHAIAHRWLELAL